MYYKVNIRSCKTHQKLFSTVIKKDDPIGVMIAGKLRARDNGIVFDKSKHYTTFRPLSTREIKTYIAKKEI